MRDNDDITRAVREHANTVARVCSLYFGSRPERDDAFQETFLKYAQEGRAFGDDEHRKAWLIRVAKNTCKDMLKRADAKTVLIDAFDDTAQPSWQAGDGQTDDRADELLEALKKLDDKYRVALYLKYYEGFTAAEIAELTNTPENTVYTNLARGREKLKEVLTRDR